MITIVGMICGTLIVLVLMGMIYNFKQGQVDGWKENVDETLNEYDNNFRLVARDMNRTETAINDILLALDKHEIKVEDTWKEQR